MSDTDTTQLIQQALGRLGEASADHHQASSALITVAFERLRKLARQMLLGFPNVQEESAAVLGEAYERLDRALRDPLVQARVRSVEDFLGLAALQIRRVLIDLARQAIRRRDHFTPLGDGGDGDDRAEEPSGDSTFDPVKLALWTEFHQQVEHLPEKERKVFELLWYHDLSRVEAAALLDVDEKTVRIRYQSAQRLLTDALGGRLPF